MVYDDGFTTVTTIRVSSGWNRLVPVSKSFFAVNLMTCTKCGELGITNKLSEAFFFSLFLFYPFIDHANLILFTNIIVAVA